MRRWCLVAHDPRANRHADRMCAAGSVFRAWRRDLCQRRMVAAGNARASAGAAVVRRLLDARSLRGDRRRDVFEWWVAAARDGAAGIDTAAAAAPAAIRRVRDA